MQIESTMLSIFHLLFSFHVEIVKIPYDNGANIKGSAKAPDIITSELQVPHVKVHEANGRHVRNILGDGFMKSWQILNKGHLP